MAYDPVDQYLVAVTSQAATWVFSGNRWAPLNTSIDPILNSETVSMAWDPAAETLVLEGAGYFGNATWTFANGTWVNVTVPASNYGGPANSGDGATWYIGAPLVYDPELQGMIAYGQFGFYTAPRTTWLWTNSTWVNITADVGSATPAFLGVWDTVGASFPGGGYSIFLVPSNPPLVHDAAVWALTDGPLVFLRLNPAYPEVGRPLAFNGTYFGGGSLGSVSFAGLPPGCSSSTISFSCVPTDPGFYTVSLTVTDALGLSGSAEVSFFVASALNASFSASPSPLDLGQAWSLEIDATGGEAPYAYSLMGPPGSCSPPGPSLQCTPNATGDFPVRVSVTDTEGAVAEWNGSVVVNPALSVTLTSGEAVVELGESDTLDVTVVGGTPPFAIHFGGTPPGCTVMVGPPFRCAPSSVGTFDLQLNVTDAAGESAISSQELTVVPALALASFGLVPASPVAEGNTVLLEAFVTGGIGPVSYSYRGLPTGCSSANTSRLPCQPTAEGSWTVTVTVTDLRGFTAEANVTLVVSGAPGLLVWWLVGGLGAGVAGVAIGVVYVRRRRNEADL